MAETNTKAGAGNGGSSVPAGSVATGTSPFKRIAKRSMSHLTVSEQGSIFVQIAGFTRDSQVMRAGGTSEANLPLLPVKNMMTGDDQLLIVPPEFRAILQKTQNAIGRKYELCRGEAQPGKRYREVEVWEIE